MSDRGARILRQMGHGALGGRSELVQPTPRPTHRTGRRTRAGQPWVTRIIAARTQKEAAAGADLVVSGGATAALQSLLDEVAAAGGGTVAVVGSLGVASVTVPSGVALVGLGNIGGNPGDHYSVHVFGTLTVHAGARLAGLSLIDVGNDTTAPVVRAAPVAGSGPAVLEDLRVVTQLRHAFELVSRTIVRRCEFVLVNPIGAAAVKAVIYIPSSSTVPQSERVFDISSSKSSAGGTKAGFLLVQAGATVRELVVRSNTIATPERGVDTTPAVLGPVTAFVGNLARLTTEVQIRDVASPVVTGNNVEARLRMLAVSDPVVTANQIIGLDVTYPVVEITASGQALVSQNVVVGRRTGGTSTLLSVGGTGSHFVHANLLRQVAPGVSSVAVTAGAADAVVHNDLRAAWSTSPVSGGPLVNLSGNRT